MYVHKILRFFLFLMVAVTQVSFSTYAMEKRTDGTYQCKYPGCDVLFRDDAGRRLNHIAEHLFYNVEQIICARCGAVFNSLDDPVEMLKVGEKLFQLNMVLDKCRKLF